jgi:probable rRNA maturation factor
MIEVNLYNQDQYPFDEAAVKDKVQSILGKYEVDQVKVDISLVNEQKIAQLNRDMMGRTGKTDVLSFPQYEQNDRGSFPHPKGELVNLGDIVVCYQTAVEESDRTRNSITDQLCFYVEHGLMHLLGYHHQ